MRLLEMNGLIMQQVIRRTLSLAALVVFASATRTAVADPAQHRLAPSLQSSRQVQVEVVVEVGGHLKVAGEEEVTTIPLRVDGKMKYDELRLDAHARTGPTDQNAVAAESLRHYYDASASIDVSGQKFAPALREANRRILARSTTTGVELASVAGPLTRDELDLIQIPGDSLLIDELLPSEQVAPGDEWTHSADLIAALVGLDAISSSDVKSRLVEVTEKVAKIEMEGNVAGASAGVASEIEIKAKYAFHLQSRLVHWMALLVKENRSIGHVAPGIESVAKLQITRRPIRASDALDDDVVQAARQAAPPRQLLHEGPSDHIRLLHDRDWHTVGDEPNLAAFRLIDRGELVAQCNVSAANLPAAEEITSVEAFQDQVKQALSQHVADFVEVSTAPHPRGYGIYRVVAEGSVAEVPIRWIYYLVFDQAGHRAGVVFTLEPDLVERFADRDQPFIEQLEFVGKSTETASAPAAQKATR